jgi:hypothetical protein
VPAAPLEASTLARFESWLDAAIRRYVPPLAFSEVRKGVQSLSSLYVERRQVGELGARSVQGDAKRAALASFYAPLHFLVTHAAIGELEPAAWPALRRAFDVGCGTGAVAAALACSLKTPPPLVLLDRSGWALAEARHTLRAFGIAAQTRRGVVPEALPHAARGELMMLGWAVNELETPARARLLDALEAAAARGAALLMLEPLAGRIAPWWSEWAQRLAPYGARERIVKREIERPAWIARLDEAAGLDHRVVGARVLALGLEPASQGHTA